MAELSPSLARLAAFRAELYACCTRRADALREFADARGRSPGRPRSSPAARHPTVKKAA